MIDDARNHEREEYTEVQFEHFLSRIAESHKPNWNQRLIFCVTVFS
jgi:hypothetical protein